MPATTGISVFNYEWMASIVLGFYFWCANQFLVLRVLSAPSVEDGRLGRGGGLRLSPQRPGRQCQGGVVYPKMQRQ